MVKIVLDAGHGAGKAFNRGGLLFNEGDQNYKYSLLLKKELEKYKNVEVLLTRKNINDDPSLEARGKMYPGADLFCSIHTNAFENSSAKGTETWVSVRNDLKFGKIFNDVTVKTLGTVDRGVKQRKQSNGQDWYGVLRNSTAKYSLLIENVFHTNLEDSKIYLAKQNELAEAQARAIASYYKLGLKENNNDMYYRVFAGSYKDRNNATKLLNELKAKGFKDAFLAYEEVDIKPSKKSNEEIAKEVLAGKWGVNPERKKKLEQAGYNYLDIQAIVNRLV